MTRKTFYRNLRRYAHLFKWRITEGDTIRGMLKNHDFCPITAVYHALENDFVGTYQAYETGKVLGLDKNDTKNIIKSADYNLKDLKDLPIGYTHLRKTLLRSLKLKERRKK